MDSTMTSTLPMGQRKKILYTTCALGIGTTCKEFHPYPPIIAKWNL